MSVRLGIIFVLLVNCFVPSNRIEMIATGNPKPSINLLRLAQIVADLSPTDVQRQPVFCQSIVLQRQQVVSDTFERRGANHQQCQTLST